MKRIFLTLVMTAFVSLLSLGCANTAPSSVSKTPAKEQSSNENLITLSNEKHELTIQVSLVPELQEYLKQYSAEEVEAEKKRMAIDSFTVDKKTVYFVLNYSCGTKLCNTILIKKTGESIQSRFLLESVAFIDYLFSPDRKKLAMRFGRNEGIEVNRQTILVMNVEDLKTREGKETTNNPLYQSLIDIEVGLPILQYSWKDSLTIEATLPKIDPKAPEEIKKWLDNNGEKQTLIVRYE
ncbi:MAG TPA: hypothetical protein VE710_13530 [Candidatus Bathyarchaeia archaeon]|nr:hypothetical protein [Candidatus Bathyarchaeia archaeon]